MQTQSMEYLTIVGDSFDEVVAECRSLGLTEKNYAIVHPIHRHQMKTAGAAASEKEMVVATFARAADVGTASS